MGSLWLARAEELGLHSVARRLGVHRYGDSGPSEEVYAAMGLSADKIAESLEELKKVAR